MARFKCIKCGNGYTGSSRPLNGTCSKGGAHRRLADDNRTSRRWMRNYTFLFISALSLSLVTCGSTPQADKTLAKSVSASIAPPYRGSGGKGISIAILAPKGTGLTENQGHIPLLVQGEFVSNFKGYSALSVMDRENLDNVYGELLSGYYADNDGAGLDLGRLTSTDYLMNGSITKTAAGYALQMQIIQIADKMTAASYSGTCTFVELDNLTGVRRASLDLLQKMGVELTERAKTELAGAAAANHVNAQTALAQGITAQQDGTVVAALSYYYQAAAFDSSLLEAASRAGVISSAISSGNIGENVRNDIQRRKEWVKILDEAETYFSKHRPFEIVYDAALVQGAVDYQRETVNLSTFVSLESSKDGFKVFEPILKGLESTGQRREWGFEFWPLGSKLFSPFVNPKNNTLFIHAEESIDLEIGLFNDRGDCVSKADIELRGRVHFALGRKVKQLEGYGEGHAISRGGDFYAIDTTKMDFDAPVSSWGISSWDGKGKLPSGELVWFRDVNANDITDAMTVKIISANGIDAERAVRDGYIRITTGAITPRGWAERFKSLFF